jgi:hypothetical protein
LSRERKYSAEVTKEYVVIYGGDSSKTETEDIIVETLLIFSYNYSLMV